MPKGKYAMPTVQQFLDRKTFTMGKKLPVWVYLEKEMRENAEKGIKPYNDIVGDWLRFLRDLKAYFRCRGLFLKYLFKNSKQHKNGEIMKKLQRAVGPAWFCELSLSQREILDNLKASIHQDLLEGRPTRTNRALDALGLTLKVPNKILKKAMDNSVEDPGVFIWNLYKAIYKQPPSELRGSYDMNAIILMSSLVFIDLKECIERLTALTAQKKPPRPEPKQERLKYYEPKCRYGMYLQKMTAACYLGNKQTYDSHVPLQLKVRIRSEGSYENLCKDTSFLEKRKDRNKKAAQQERVCTYNFWEPPGDYLHGGKMLKLSAVVKFKSDYPNLQYQIAGVSYVRGRPQYLLSNVALLPTGYVSINGGMVRVNDTYVTTVHGFWLYPKPITEKCDLECDCLAKWEGVVLDYLKESKCKCGHLYDYFHPTGTGMPKDKYFHPPTRQGPFWIDKAKIFAPDSMEDFIKDTVAAAIISEPPSSTVSTPSLGETSDMKIKDLLAAFLADLSDTPLLIPHLPQANLLNNLQEWVRHRVRGKLDPKDHKKFILQSQRSWLQLKHINFRELAYLIPFSLKELKHMNWTQRYMIQEMYLILQEDFTSRNRKRLFEQTRLWWPTTKFDAYPSKAFLDIFFTYMPSRMKDIYLINPFSSENTPKYGAKTCKLVW